MGKEVPVSDHVFRPPSPRPVLSQTHAVTEVQSLLTSSANRVSYVEPGHQELVLLKTLK